MSFSIPGSGSRHGSSGAKSKTYAYTRPASSSYSTSRSAPAASNFFGSTFGGGSTSRSGPSTSYYKRRPRDGYIARLVAKIKRLLADLYRYIRKNPVKVLLPIAMALVSGGALHNLARGMGVSLPEGLKNVVGMGDAARSVRGGYDAWYGSQNAAPSGFGQGLGGGGAGGWLSSGLKVASAFM